MKDDSLDCTLIAHLRIFLLFYRLLYCLILPENRLFFGIWKVVEIEVEDEGMGIPAEELHKIYQRFYRGRKAKEQVKDGAGVGLYLARKIIEEQGGTIAAKRKAEKGMIFKVTLPLIIGE